MSPLLFDEVVLDCDDLAEFLGARAPIGIARLSLSLSDQKIQNS